MKAPVRKLPRRVVYEKPEKNHDAYNMLLNEGYAQGFADAQEMHRNAEMNSLEAMGQELFKCRQK